MPAIRAQWVAAAATAATAALAVLPAALLAITLWDRTSLAGLSRPWVGTLLVAAALLLLWVLLPQLRCGAATPVDAALSLLPAAVAGGALVLAVYVSEDAHHAFVYRPHLKGMAVPVVAVLAVAAPWLAEGIAGGRAAASGERGQAAGAAFDAAIARHERLLVALTLGVAGVSQALSFCTVATDDAIRYWAVADGLRAGAGYPVTTGTAGSAGFYLVELPLYPLLLLPSFAIAGHRFLALELPLIAANVALPYVLYGIARAVGTSRVAALALALVVLCVPYYQAYALGAAQPEVLLAVELGLTLLLAVPLIAPQVMRDSEAGGDRRALKHPATPTKDAEAPSRLADHQEPAEAGFVGVAGGLIPRRWGHGDNVRWAVLGFAGAAAALTRPEGVLYVAPLFAGLAWHYRRDVLRGWATGFWVALACCAVPVIAFSAFLWSRFGILWPAGWTNVAGPQFAAQNARLVWRQDLPAYAAAAGLPAPSTAGPAVAVLLGALTVVGLWRFCRRWPDFWFVPVALLLNLAVIFVSPTFLTPDLFSPGTFFRHVSVLIPWLTPAWAAFLTKDEGRKTESGALSSFARRPSSFARRPSSFARRPSSFALAAAAPLLVWELAILGTSAARNQARAPTVLTSDPYVLVADLPRVDDSLPVLPFTIDARGIATVDPSFDYFGMRNRLFAAVRPRDLHTNDAGLAYALATGVVGLAGLGALALARRRTPAPGGAR